MEDRAKRLWLLVGMGLAGILTIALIVSADQSYAGVDGLRAITAYPPTSEQDPPRPSPIPVITGVLDGLRELPIFGPAPAAPSSAPLAISGSAGPRTLPPTAPPTDQGRPVAVLPGPSTTTPATLAPATPTPATPPPPSAPAPSPTPTPTPTLALTTDRGATAIVNLGDLVPGDSMIRTITLNNTGTLAFRYTVSAAHTASTPLWTNTTNGLQLTVATATGTVLYRGPLSGLGAIASPTTLAPGATELLGYTFDFPAGAPDAFQGLAQDLTLVFTATQYP